MFYVPVLYAIRTRFLKRTKLGIFFWLAEYQYPILFTCIDEEKNMYIATCFHVDAEKREFLIAKTEPKAVKELLTDKRTIRNVFPDKEDTVYVVTVYKWSEEPMIIESRAADVNSHYFPSCGIFMDAEDDEFEDELSILDARIELQKEKRIQASMQIKVEMTDVKAIQVCFCKNKQGKILSENDYRIAKRSAVKGKVQYA